MSDINNQSLMYEDFKRAGPIEAIAIALSRFVETIVPGRFEKAGQKWIYRPNNFVTFEVQPRKVGILLTLRGTPGHFRERAVKLLVSAMSTSRTLICIALPKAVIQ